jgi:chromosome segregation ATPase
MKMENGNVVNHKEVDMRTNFWFPSMLVIVISILFSIVNIGLGSSSWYARARIASTLDNLVEIVDVPISKAQILTEAVDSKLNEIRSGVSTLQDEISAAPEDAQITILEELRQRANEGLASLTGNVSITATDIQKYVEIVDNSLELLAQTTLVHQNSRLTSAIAEFRTYVSTVTEQTGEFLNNLEQYINSADTSLTQERREFLLGILEKVNAAIDAIQTIVGEVQQQLVDVQSEVHDAREKIVMWFTWGAIGLTLWMAWSVFSSVIVILWFWPNRVRRI